jgi:pimeloyl-ACP methyl ester carboxylesterase
VQLRDACKEWPSAGGAVRAGEPARIDVPALLLSGEVDSNTPPRFGDELSRLWPKSRHVVLKGVAHSLAGGFECASTLISAFFAAGAADGLDTTCASSTARPPFRP